MVKTPTFFVKLWTKPEISIQISIYINHIADQLNREVSRKYLPDLKSFFYEQLRN